MVGEACGKNKTQNGRFLPGFEKASPEGEDDE
jgi:hypothetical protein